jgi:hypothetical protein
VSTETLLTVLGACVMVAFLIYVGALTWVRCFIDATSRWLSRPWAEDRARIERIQADVAKVIEAPQPLEAWTPLQRDALGIDETDSLILRIQRELNQLEWAEITDRQVLPPAEPQVTRLYGWGQVEPVRTMVDGRTITAGRLPDPARDLAIAQRQLRKQNPERYPSAADEARRKRFEDSPTVTGERVFG